MRFSSLFSLLFLLACGEKEPLDSDLHTGETADTGQVETCTVTPVLFDYSDQASWVEDSPDCGLSSQSPVDINEGSLSPGEVPGLAFSYGATPLKVVNNGHSIEFEVDEGSSITLDGRTYAVKQFHFHAPSEHTVGGEHTPMEMHIVHKDGSDLAVVGVFILEGEEDHSWFADAGWDALPSEPGECVEDEDHSLDLAQLMGTLDGELPSAAWYSGSLTTPPCTEQVNWVLMEQTLSLSSTQIQDFTDRYSGNNRMVQSLGDRVLTYDSDTTQ